MQALCRSLGIVDAVRAPFDEASTFVLDQIPHAANSDHFSTWVYLLSNVVELLEIKTAGEWTSRSTLIQLLQDARLKTFGIMEHVDFEYHIRGQSGAEEHAFCRVPVGLLQLRTLLWRKRLSLLSIADDNGLRQSTHELFGDIYSANEFPCMPVRSLSLAIRILARYPTEIESLL
jgi:hypothetical protein